MKVIHHVMDVEAPAAEIWSAITRRAQPFDPAGRG